MKIESRLGDWKTRCKRLWKKTRHAGEPMAKKKIVLPATSAEKTGDNSGILVGRRPTILYFEIGIPANIVKEHKLPKDFIIDKAVLTVDIED